MPVRLIQVPYDSGHRARRMGRGPLHLVAAGALDRLAAPGGIALVPIEADAAFATEIGSAFDLHRGVAASVRSACSASALPLILSGNCNSAIGTVAGLQAAGLGDGLGVIWFDGHGDCNTPETFIGSFLDAMALSTLTGRCWQELAGTVPDFRPLRDETVLLLGGHGADPGARRILADSGIGWEGPEALRCDHEGGALDRALARMASLGVSRVYLHLDVDVLDADYAPANGFAPPGGLMPEQLSACVALILRRFPVAAAAVASYDPGFDRADRVRDMALGFLEQVAGAAAPPAQTSP